jgi:hypothetical protein
MLPVDFPGSNLVLNKPDSFTDEQCMSKVPAFFGLDEDTNCTFYMTAWRPNKDDLESLNSGGSVFVKIMVKEGQAPPHSTFTISPEGFLNYVK